MKNNYSCSLRTPAKEREKEKKRRRQEKDRRQKDSTGS